MSEKRTLATIAETAFWNAESENKNTFDRVAKAVEKEVLARLKKSEFEPVAGQELTHHQVLDWIEKHGSTKGLQWRDNSGNWRDDDATVIYAFVDYRVAPKKVNVPDDPTTWEKGVAIFRRDAEDAAWILDVFRCYKKNLDFKYATNVSSWRYAKLATPEQIEAWKLINGEL